MANTPAVDAQAFAPTNGEGAVANVRLYVVLAAVEEELRKAQSRYVPFRSPMEGLAIVEEEMDEFKQAVRHGTREQVWKECVQLAAMATRYLHDIGGQHAERTP